MTLHNLRVGASKLTLPFWTEGNETRYEVLSGQGELLVERHREPEADA